MEQISPINQTIFYRIQISPWVGWLIFIILLWVGHFLLAYLTKSEFYAIAMTSEAILIYLAGIAPIYASKQLKSLKPVYRLLLDTPEKEILRFVHKNTEEIFSTKRLLLSGFVLPIIVTPLVIILFQEQKGHELLKFYDIGLSYITWFLCSMAGSIVPSLLSGWYKLRNMHLRAVAIFFPWKGVRSISLIASRFTIMVSLAYSLMIIFLLFGPTRFGTTGYWYVIAGIAVCIATFVIPQWCLHLALINMKNQLLERYANEIQKAYKKLIQETSGNNIKNFNDLLSFNESLNKLKEWPFNFDSIYRFIGSLIMIIAVKVFEIFALPKGA